MPVSSRTDLTGQVAVITGAARGIGRATAVALAAEGTDLVVGDLLDLSDTVAQVEAAGRRCVPLRTDVTQQADAAGLATAAVEAFGRLDMLVTCAGVYGAGGLDVDEREWDRVLDVNVKGTYLPVQAAFPVMAEAGRGKIVCIGSIAGKVGGVLAGPHYVASKGAIHALVRWLAKHGAQHGVYANGIAPGAVRTDMIEGHPYREDYCPLGRFAEPEDIAQTAVYLASQASNYVTGKVLTVDGGYVLSD
ncbi:MAG: SDR family NAD(P)-dependent oxidoreductase [Mycobacteriales bacterium]